MRLVLLGPKVKLFRPNINFLLNRVFKTEVSAGFRIIEKVEVYR